MTKIIHRDCKECGKTISMLVTDISIVLAVRCPSCLKEFFEDVDNLVPE